MTFTGPIYRPPWEADSLLLQVTVGCAHNKCNFCTMYRDTPFSIDPFEQIENDIIEARKQYRKVNRIFLVNGDAFVLSARRLKPIAEKIIEYFPEVEVITMYSSINNIKNKTDEELVELRKLRVNELWVGVETAHGEALKYLNKGSTIEDTRSQLKRLNKAGMDFFYGFMYGAAGKGRGIETAIENAKLINATNPVGIAPTTLGANEGTPLKKDVEKGIFELATEREIYEEMIKTIELIDTDDLIYYGAHAINTIPFNCILPRDKKIALNSIEGRIAELSNDFLDSVPVRHSI
ncbi:MAG: radical SAM protein [Spirochaetales bacterium]|uniref:Radical SAM protein n=1 Tax=Candidatus Thalassospirochaeta sargassi TaxID=3119039 RepID=A0AAJ1ML54_9SPIO|nr:radical SAM protein [Spirochaetales bacterium]